MSIHDVIVTIDIQKPTPKLSFGKTLIIGSSETGQDYKSYANLEAVKLISRALAKYTRRPSLYLTRGIMLLLKLRLCCTKLPVRR